MLDGIRTRLVKRIAGLHVRLDLLIGIVPHRHICHAEILEEKSIPHTAQRNPGVDLMRVPAQPFEHRDGLRAVVRFAENVRSIHPRSIRGEDDLV